MKTLLNLLKIIVLGIFLFSFTSCNDDDTMPVPEVEATTIVDFVATNDDYSSLEAALEVTGLTATLDGTASFTVFALNNDAFASFLSDNEFSSLNDVPKELLTKILFNHVQSGAIMSSDLSTGYIQSMAVGNASMENLSMYINTESGVEINGVSNVVTPDIEVDHHIRFGRSNI